MTGYESALVVDASGAAAVRLAEKLRSFCERTHCVTSLEAARTRVACGTVSLLVIDAELEGAFEWLEECTGQPEHPAVLIVTRLPRFEEEIRATLLGAIGYLPHPVTAGTLACALTGIAAAQASHGSLGRLAPSR